MKKVQAELEAIKQAKEHERKAKHRANKTKVNTPDLLNSPSTTTNASYGKVIARIKHTLSRSPGKQRAAMKYFAFKQIKIKPFSTKKKKCLPGTKHQAKAMLLQPEMSKGNKNCKNNIL